MKEKIKIKTLSNENFEDIINIQKNDGFKHIYYLNENRLSELIKRGEVFYGIYSDSSLVGFTSIDIEIRAKLHFLSIDKKYQGKGYATLLMKKIIEELKLRDIKQLFFYVEKNSPHEAFLKTQGFSKVGFYVNRFGDGWDADIYELKIEK
ncbi:GNAT family N-acetyltransferase [Patescibacteria group bacterium]|nr:GNAT family N-acetyltransferase [Patescibacteria group bacterium]